MKQIIYICALCLAFPLHVQAQQLDEYRFLPKDFENPEWGGSIQASAERSLQAWVVYPDRDGVLFYKSSSLESVVDTAIYLEPLFVWQETGDALRVVSRSEPGDIFYGTVFSELAVERGWIRKDQLILWPQALKKDGLFVKAIVPKTSVSTISNPAKPGANIEVPEDKFRIYNVLKSERQTLLLMETDQMHEYLNRSDVFWVNTSEVYLLEERAALVPKWNNLETNMDLNIYNSLSGAQNQNSSDILKNITSPDPYLGFLEMTESEENIFSALLPSMGTWARVYLNNSDGMLEKAYLLDDSQFQLYQRLVGLISDHNYSDPVDLEIALADFFIEYGFDPEKIPEYTVGQLLEKVTGLSFKVESTGRPTRVNTLAYSRRNELLMNYSVIYDNLERNELSPYIFGDGMRYYWLPESLIQAEQLMTLALEDTGGPDQVPIPYEHFEIFYVDGSMVKNMEAYTFDQMYTDFKTSIKNAASLANTESASGIYGYYSDGINTIKNEARRPIESTIDAMLVKLDDNANFPDKNRDKMAMEKELFTQHLASVQQSLVVHFYIPQRFFEEDIWERGFMLMDLPERIYSLTVNKEQGKASIHVNLYSITDEERLDRDIAEISEYYGNSEVISFKFNKYQ